MGVVFVGDMGGDGTDQKKVSKEITSTSQSHLVFLGDLHYAEDTKTQSKTQLKTQSKDVTDQFTTYYKDIFDRRDSKFWLCVGNHDYMENGKHVKQLVEYSKKTHGKVYLPKRLYYHAPLQEEDIDLFIVDTNLEEYTKTAINTQLEYMRDLIDKSKLTWKIICGHHTWRSVGGHGNAESDLEQFLQTLTTTCKHPIDMYMCGHDHCKCATEITLPGGRLITSLVIGTGGAAYTYNHSYTDYQRVLQKPDTQLLFYSPYLGFANVNTIKGGNVLCVDLIDERGSKEETLHVSKS